MIGHNIAKCLHCGKEWMVGDCVPDICSECERAGHRGMNYGCPVCNRGRHNEQREALRILRAIDLLRADEGASVTICCDNPELGGPNCQIQVCDGWTGWKDRSFTGETVLGCLHRAIVERDQRTGRNDADALGAGE